MGSASAHLFKGTGPFHLHTALAGLHATIQGTANLPERLIQGRAAAANILWEGKRLNKINLTFSLSPRHQELNASAVTFQSQPPVEKPLDILAAHWDDERLITPVGCLRFTSI